MIELKDFADNSRYDYNVCQILSCELKGTEFYSDAEETKAIDVCRKHYKYLQQIKFW